MFAAVLGFEWRYQLRNPVFRIAILAFFLFAFGSTAVERIQIGSGGNVHKNAPSAIAQMTLTMTLFYMFVSTAFVANVVTRDEESGFGPIVRATRITKGAYLFGRFGGAFLAAAVGFLAVPLGAWLGSHMPWVDPETLGPKHVAYYASAYVCLALPNILLTSALFFALATMTRSMMATYLGVVAFLVLFTVSVVVLARNPAYELAGAIGEPLGFGATRYLTRYWTAADRNALTIPIAGLVLWNRLLSLGLSVLALALAFVTFRFGAKSTRKRRKRDRSALQAEAPPTVRSVASLPAPRYGYRTAVAQLVASTRLEAFLVFRSPAYLVLLALGLFNAVAALTDVSETYGTPVLPVTRVVIRLLFGSFSIIPIVIAVYYAGELVWRDRDRRTHEIIDASPVPDLMLLLPKVTAVTLVMLSTMLVGVAGAVAMQLLHGYAHLEPAKYLLWYVLPQTVDLTLIATLAISVQALSPNKFVGWGAMVLFIVARSTFAGLGFGDVLYNYATGPEVPLSDMNGQGRFWIGAWWLRLYWAAFAAALLVLVHALWRRGTDAGLRIRLRSLPRRLNGGAGLVGAAALGVFGATGAWIYLNTHVWNEYRTPLSDERFAADYEKALLRFADLPQPSVKAVRVAVDLRPSEPGLTAAGRLTLVNLTGVRVGAVHVRLNDRYTRIVSISIPGATLQRDFARFRYRIYHLATPLEPGATTTLEFHTERRQRGFANSGNDMRVVSNGTFVDSGKFVPVIGVRGQDALQDRARRRKYGLPSELRPPRLEDLGGTRRNAFFADWVSTDITVSTSADQTPIAPGDKVSDTTSDGRRTARFVSSSPILNVFSIQSGRYLERHLNHDDVDLAVYYDPQHGANVDRMLAAFARGLDLYQAAFGPYQFHYARIVEFPDYAQFAQAFAGTMPYSEGIGFIADLSNRSRIDYVSYVVAHELAHQWWGHQVVTSDNQGALMGTETLAQYGALMVMEHMYGRDQIRRFLKYELDRYLRGRSGEIIEELPLSRVENQPYVYYRKGSVSMYRLKDELGEARINSALKRYAARFRFSGPPYPRSVDLIAELRRGATPAEDALITDLFERMTLYDIKVRAAQVKRLPDGRFRTKLTVEAHKLYADGRGRETEVPMAESVEVGAFSAMPGFGSFAARDVLALRRVPLRSGVQAVAVDTATRPSFAGADPYNVRIDRNSDDNVVATE